MSVVNSCHYDENFKNGKHGLWANALPSGAAPTNPPRAKAWMQKPQGGGQIVGANPWGCAGGWLLDEIDTCIMVTQMYNTIFEPNIGVRSSSENVTINNMNDTMNEKNKTPQGILCDFLGIKRAVSRDLKDI